MSMRIALVKEYTGRRLTWWSWLFILFLLIGLAGAFLFNLYSFMTPDKLPKTGIMVVEGWIHDFALDEAVFMYRGGDYSKIICTGVPVETGSYIQDFDSYPEMTRARLIQLGIPKDQIIIAEADDSQKDRTYRSAEAMRNILIAYNIDERNFHLVTVGPHGRRSRMLFQKALGKDYRIGVTCLEPGSYDPESWYTCSEGVRDVVGEFIAYTYAKLFFHP